jgi:phosphoribosylformylglycinamidine synthase
MGIQRARPALARPLRTHFLQERRISAEAPMTILILHAPGTNRDAEAARAIELAGGTAEIVHINQLRRGARALADYAALLLPGGFSYGDALGAGARLALDLRVYFEDALRDFVARGRPVLGICNGFQTLVKAGLLPETPPDAPRRVTLAENAGGHFECRWVTLQPNPEARAGWLQGLAEPILCPVAHGEGNVQVRDGETLEELAREGLVAFRYVDGDGQPAAGRYPLNPNGSAGDIAGLCSRQGNVVGLMPHPEDHILPIQNPLRDAPGAAGSRLGLPLFARFVAAAR